MMIEISDGMSVSSVAVVNYIDSLVNKFFKILPMREESEPSLNDYICNFKHELVGCGNLITSLHDDGIYISILSVLQYLSEIVCDEEFEVADVRREVFNAISLCNKLKMKYQKEGAS